MIIYYSYNNGYVQYKRLCIIKMCSKIHIFILKDLMDSHFKLKKEKKVYWCIKKSKTKGAGGPLVAHPSPLNYKKKLSSQAINF